MNFEPRTVPSDSWRSWLKETLNLTARRPFLWAFNYLFFFSLFYEMSSWEYGLYPIYLLSPVLILTSMVIGQAADESTSTIEILKNFPLRQASTMVFLQLLVLATIIAIITTIFIAAHLIDPSLLDKASPESENKGQLLEAISNLQTGIVWSLLIIDTLGVLFYPLYALGGAPFSEAKKQHRIAVDKNNHVRFVAVAFLSVSFLSFFANSLALILILIFPSFMYVAYRDIWLGRGKNKPVEKKSFVLLPALSR